MSGEATTDKSAETADSGNAEADTATDADDGTEESPADSVQFSVVFDEDDDDTDIDAASESASGSIYDSLAAAEQSAGASATDVADESDDSGDAVIDKDDVTAALIASATGADPTRVKEAAGLKKAADNGAKNADASAENKTDETTADATTDAVAPADAASVPSPALPPRPTATVGDEPSEAEADALASANASAEVTARNAQKVNETLALAKSDEKNPLAGHKEARAKSEPTMTLASRIDRVLVGGGADDVLLKTYPTYALNKVTMHGPKGKLLLDNVGFSCYAGHSYALLIQDDPDSGLTADAKRRTLMGVMTGLIHPGAGAVMNKSANIAELDPIELRGHRLGIVPQRHALQPYLDAEKNVLYAMNASNRNFLKPKPVIARELLAKVGFTEATSGVAVGKLPEVQQRLVAIARAISTEAEVLILDEPTHGLNEDDTVTVFAALAKLAHSGDPKRCVIVLTASREIAEAADTLFEI
ncbi:ATP-binding cassette domain-containing protein [Bifidobacterium callitrichidarum]